MDGHVRSLRGCCICAVFATLLPGVGQAQGAQSVLLTGEVVDPLKIPLAQVEVLVKDTAHQVVATARTDSEGTFLVRGLADHTHYQILARRLGYTPATATVVTSWGGDTLWIDFQLLTVTPTKLDSVKVVAKTNNSGLFAKLTRVYDKLNSVLATIDAVYDKLCRPDDPGAPGLHICLKPQ